MCWIKPDNGDTVEDILEAFAKSLPILREHLANCPQVGVPGHRYAATYIEIEPLEFEARGQLIEKLRERFPSPPDQQFNINEIIRKRLKYILMTPYRPEAVQEAPPNLDQGMAVLA